MTGSAETVELAYSVSLAVALCEGEITRVGRVWADGEEVAPDDLNMRVYLGTEDQMPDPKMEAVDGAGMIPAYRGMAYVVFEDLVLGRFGNHVPQFSFEVFRPAPARPAAQAEDLAHLIRGVAMIPGTGEYSLATTPAFLSQSYGEQVSVNVNTPSGKTDFLTSLDAFTEELPECRSVSLVVSWFGSDLRCGLCSLRPKIEQNETDAAQMPWQVSGLSRGQATPVPRIDDRPVYGGTPADAAVIESIRELVARGQDVVFYPFILMDQLTGNGRADPWSGAVDQPPLPWRGRITTSKAPGQPDSPDQTVAATMQVANFFGAAQPGDFSPTANGVNYNGPDEWSMRRFILHYAHLCAVAGGVTAFCIGSEMRALTQIRDAPGSFPAVGAFRQLAAEVKAILGPSCKIGYAADWSEYHGYQPEGSGDKYFNLDPLWADPAIDFIGIDNYMPLSDWRDGEDHADAGAGAIYNLDYLTANVAGGEGYDWYYHSPEAQEAQIRTPISDFWGEDFVWRYKDIKGWWLNPHHNRVDGVRSAVASPWVPQSKPVWFTEFGCAAIDKGTNEPNKFLDPKSSESFLPRYSNGLRDDLMQMQYLRAFLRHYEAVGANPVSDVYGGKMVDMSRAHVWAWDARPFPYFPANAALWSDGANYARGHWLNGRTTARALDSVVREICARAGVTAVDTKRLYGLVRGYRVDATDTARAALQPLMLAYGFDVVERDGVLVFFNRTGLPYVTVPTDLLVLDAEAEATLELVRAPAAEIAGRVRIGFVDAEADYDVRASEAVFADEATYSVSHTELPLALTLGEGQRIAERWLAEARVARDSAKFALPPSAVGIGAGHVIRLTAQGEEVFYRVDRIEQRGFQAIEAVRVEPEVYRPHEADDETAGLRAFVSPVPIAAVFLDLPLLSGDEVPHAPHLAMASAPWPGNVALYASAQDSNYKLSTVITQPSVIGQTLTPLTKAAPGLIDRGPALRVRLVRGALASVTPDALLAGANVAAIGDGLSDAWEVFQFAEAELVGPNTYDLRSRLRGQAGTDGIMPADWPVGSRFVLLNGVPEQIALKASSRDLERHYRYGPAARPIDDVTYRYEVRAFRGIGLRPYSVCHVRAVPDGSGGHDIVWTRRTRIDGDNWNQAEVPLAEASETYLVQVRYEGVIRRSETIAVPNWGYSAADRVADGVGGPFEIEVAQISDRFGPGPLRIIEVAP